MNDCLYKVGRSYRDFQQFAHFEYTILKKICKNFNLREGPINSYGEEAVGERNSRKLLIFSLNKCGENL